LKTVFLFYEPGYGNVLTQAAAEVVILEDAFPIGGVFEAVKSGVLAGCNL
jgi:hypothetical protein